jgi:hypothetical protein
VTPRSGRWWLAELGEQGTEGLDVPARMGRREQSDGGALVEEQRAAVAASSYSGTGLGL